MEIKREHHINFWYIIATVMAVMLIQDFLVGATQTKAIPYSEFQQLVDQGQVTDLVVGQTEITGTFKDPKQDEPKQFSTYRVPPVLADKLTAAKLPSSGESVDAIAALTPGFSGADLANLVNEAALLATRRSGDNVTLADFTQAIERIVAGLEKRSRILNPHERDVVAHHEMGHALVAMSLPGVDPVQKVSIIPHGIAAPGYTMQRPIEDRFLMDRAELVNRMTVLLGGRAAEGLTYDEVSTGAGDDLAKATDIARSMVMRFGMDKTLGQVSYEPERSALLETPGAANWQMRQYGEATAAAIDAAVRALIEDAFTRATAILTANRVLLDQSARELLTKETFSADELQLLATKLGRRRVSA